MITFGANGNAVVVNFGDVMIKIPLGYSAANSEVRLGKGGVVYFFANGEEDFLSIVLTIFGEEPNFIPFEYSIVFDKHRKGIQELRKLIKCIFAFNWAC